MRKLILSALTLFFISTVSAQADSASTGTWKTAGLFSLTANQVSLTNWQAGGENSVSANGLFKYSFNYTKGKFSWENEIELGYGVTKQGDNDYEKTDDRISYSIKAGHQMNDNWTFNGFGSFRTQFTNGFSSEDKSTVISKFMAPAYIEVGTGFLYTPLKWFSANLSPIAGKITIVNDDTLSAQGAFGVDAGEKVRFELGAIAEINIKKELMENVTLESKAKFFSSYSNNPQNIDVNWDLLLVMKVNKWLSANLTTNLIYDDDINIVVKKDDQGNVVEQGPRVQFKEVFGAGLTLTF